MAFQTQTQNLSALATQCPKSHPCPQCVHEIAALNSKSQLDTLRLGAQLPKSHWPLSFNVSKSQRFKSQRLQDANATKSQTLVFHKSQHFSASKPKKFMLFFSSDSKHIALLDGQNLQSPIASVQRTRSTLARHSAIPRGTTSMNANRGSQRNERNAMNAGSMRTNSSVL